MSQKLGILNVNLTYYIKITKNTKIILSYLQLIIINHSNTEIIIFTEYAKYVQDHKGYKGHVMHVDIFMRKVLNSSVHFHFSVFF
jgi:hypothetical protein